MSTRRIAMTAGLIAFAPAAAWWLLASLLSDPDEGANIGAGIVLLGILALCFVAALAFVSAAVVQRKQREAPGKTHA